MSDTTRDDLEAERDFFLRSLDDLERERAAGGVDEESYRALRDDYTARAAATIRRMKTGEKPEVREPSRRKLWWVIGWLTFVGVLAVATLLVTLTNRLPGQTSSGNTSTENVPSLHQRIARLEAAVTANPDDVASRLLLAQLLEAKGDLAATLQQYDAVLARSPDNTRALADSGRVLYIAAQAVAGDAADQLVRTSRERLDRAIALDAGFVEARYYRAIVLAYEFQDYRGAQSDLQRYLIAAPDGTFAKDAKKLLADVTNALEPPTSTTRKP